MFNKPSNKDLDEFSRSLARELAEHTAADGDGEALSKKQKRKLGRSLDRIYLKATEYQLEHKLGIYGRARLGNTFKWELKDMGYQDEFVDEATKRLVLSLNRK